MPSELSFCYSELTPEVQKMVKLSEVINNTFQSSILNKNAQQLKLCAHHPLFNPNYMGKEKSHIELAMQKFDNIALKLLLEKNAQVYNYKSDGTKDISIMYPLFRDDNSQAIELLTQHNYRFDIPVLLKPSIYFPLHIVTILHYYEAVETITEHSPHTVWLKSSNNELPIQSLLTSSSDIELSNHSNEIVRSKIIAVAHCLLAKMHLTKTNADTFFKCMVKIQKSISANANFSSELKESLTNLIKQFYNQRIQN